MEAETLIILPNVIICQCIIRIFLDFEYQNTETLIMPVYHTFCQISKCSFSVTLTLMTI